MKLRHYRNADGSIITPRRRLIGHVVAELTLEPMPDRLVYRAWEPSLTPGVHKLMHVFEDKRGTWGEIASRLPVPVADFPPPEPLVQHAVDEVLQISNANLAYAYVFAAFPDAIVGQRNRGEVWLRPHAVEYDLEAEPGHESEDGFAYIVTPDARIVVEERSKAKLKVAGNKPWIYSGQISGLTLTGEADVIEQIYLEIREHTLRIADLAHQPNAA